MRHQFVQGKSQYTCQNYLTIKRFGLFSVNKNVRLYKFYKYVHKINMPMDQQNGSHKLLN